MNLDMEKAIAKYNTIMNYIGYVLKFIIYFSTMQLNYIQETTMLKQFIDMYEPYTKKMICSTGHCSRFDN